jgi:DNA-binding response OmpR family regulator
MVEAPPLAEGRVLVADDSLMARVFLTRLLAADGLEVDGAENGFDARAALEAGAFAFAFLDFDMPGGGALEVLAGLAPARRPRVCVLAKDEDERQRAIALGLGPAILKPFAEDEVLAALAALRAGAGESNP